MEPVVLERQQCTYRPVAEPAADPVEELLAGPLAAVQLAERGDFPRLLVALALRPRLARAADNLGMTALHWACSDPSAPARVLATVARAHPAAAATRNLAGLLPMHLAIRKRLHLPALQAVIQAYPRAVAVATPEGYAALALAKSLRPAASSDVLALLRVLEAHARTGTPELAASQWQWPEQPEDDEPAGPVTDQLGATHSIREERALLSASVSQPPPRWALSSRCRLCAAKFGYFRQRHHCRNCGASVCGRHSRHRVPLKHLGALDDKPQRVCAVCFDDLQQEHNARALARVATSGDASGLQLQLHIAEPSPVHLRYRRRSKSVYSEPPLQEPMPFDLDNNNSIAGGHFDTDMFPTPGRRRNWSSATTTEVSVAASGPTLQPDTGSMFIQRGRPKQPTVLERQRQLRQQLEECPDPEETRRSSRRRLRPRPHSSALDKALHVQRLSEADSGHSSDEQELAQRMQRLEAAKLELGDAVRRSERELRRAQSEKRELDAVADKYRASGYASPQEDEDEEAEKAATEAFLRRSKRLEAELAELEPPLGVAATHHELGVALLDQGDYARAVTELQRSVELDGEDARAWLHLAKARDELGEDSEAAEEAVRCALELEPHSLAALSLLGKLLHVRGDHDDAIHVFRHALELQCSAATGLEDDNDPTSATM